MSSQTIEITAQDGGRFTAYLAKPAQGSGPGLVLLQEIFGINDYMKSMADRYAEEGYVVLVPDLFWRMKPGVVLGYGEADFARRARLSARDSTIDEAHRRYRRDTRCVARAARACGQGRRDRLLPRRPLALRTAARTDVDCAVSYYGVGLDAISARSPPSAARWFSTSPKTMRFTPPKPARRSRPRLRANRMIEHYVYPGCDHAFAAPAREHYDKPAALMAYSRTLSLLRKVLGPVYDLNRAVGNALLLRVRARATSTPSCRPWSPSPTSTTFRP